MSYQVRNITDFRNDENVNEISDILQNKLIKHALEKGAWLAGGFPRQILLGRSIQSYFSPRGDSPRGDIDVFSPTVACAQEITSTVNPFPSQGGFAKNTSALIPLVARVTVQIVDDPNLCHKTVEDCFDRFDFVNCQAAIKGDKIIFNDEIFDLEERKLLKLTNSNTPFLGSRIVKYMKHRGMVGITDDSIHHLSDWLVKSSMNAFPGYNTRHLTGIESAVKRLAKEDVLRKDDFLFFLGKWQHVINNRGSYGKNANIIVDWASHHLKDPKEASCVI